MAFQAERTAAAATDSINNQCRSLEQRLNEGYSRIEAALEAGQDVASWERFWIDLLHEYEAVCNQFQQAA